MGREVGPARLLGDGPRLSVVVPSRPGVRADKDTSTDKVGIWSC